MSESNNTPPPSPPPISPGFSIAFQNIKQGAPMPQPMVYPQTGPQYAPPQGYATPQQSALYFGQYPQQSAPLPYAPQQPLPVQAPPQPAGWSQNKTTPEYQRHGERLSYVSYYLKHNRAVFAQTEARRSSTAFIPGWQRSSNGGSI